MTAMAVPRLFTARRRVSTFVGGGGVASGGNTTDNGEEGEEQTRERGVRAALPSGGYMQVPFMRQVLVQQRAALPRQGAPAAMQAQRPLVQVPLQHWLPAVHAPMVPTQQLDVPMLMAQLFRAPQLLAPQPTD